MSEAERAHWFSLYSMVSPDKKSIAANYGHGVVVPTAQDARLIMEMRNALPVLIELAESVEEHEKYSDMGITLYPSSRMFEILSRLRNLKREKDA